MAAGGSVTRQNRFESWVKFLQISHELKLFYYKRTFVINAITKFKSCPGCKSQAVFRMPNNCLCINTLCVVLLLRVRPGVYCSELGSETQISEQLSPQVTWFL